MRNTPSYRGAIRVVRDSYSQFLERRQPFTDLRGKFQHPPSGSRIRHVHEKTISAIPTKMNVDMPSSNARSRCVYSVSTPTSLRMA